MPKKEKSRVPALLRFGAGGVVLSYSAPSSDLSVEQRLESHNEYFEEFIGLIPPEHYFHARAADGALPNHRFIFKKGGTKPKEVRKALREAKFDVLEEKGGAAAPFRKEEDDGMVGKKRGRSVQHGLNESGVEEGDEGSGMLRSVTGDEQGRATSIEELKQRLHDKIEALRSQRMGTPSAKRARKLKKDRQKGKKVEEKKKGGEKETEGKAGENGVDGGGEAGGEAGGVIMDLDFGSISAKPRGAAAIEEERRERMKKRAKGGGDLATLLHRAKRNEARLRELGGEAAAKAKEDDEWSKALARASGEKIKDDPKLLKKALKRKEKSKEKSRREWAARLAQQQAEQTQRAEEKARRRLKGRHADDDDDDKPRRRAGPYARRDRDDDDDDDGGGGGGGGGGGDRHGGKGGKGGKAGAASKKSEGHGKRKGAKKGKTRPGFEGKRTRNVN